MCRSPESYGSGYCNSCPLEHQYGRNERSDILQFNTTLVLFGEHLRYDFFEYLIIRVLVESYLSVECTYKLTYKQSYFFSLLSSTKMLQVLLSPVEFWRSIYMPECLTISNTAAVGFKLVHTLGVCPTYRGKFFYRPFGVCLPHHVAPGFCRRQRLRHELSLLTSNECFNTGCL